MNFYSVSSDGKVFNWVLMQNELAQTLVIVLYLEMDAINGPDGTMIRMSGKCRVKQSVSRSSQNIPETFTTLHYVQLQLNGSGLYLDNEATSDLSKNIIKHYIHMF